jgi:integrative and conjugative element protein (TIGR02256 family)
MDHHRPVDVTEPDPGPRPRLLVAAPALRRATTAGTNATPNETGGVLLGFRSGNDVCVTDLIEVAAAAVTHTRYASDETDRNAAIDAFLATSNDDRVGYVGTWHSHPGSSKASPRDRRTLRDEAAQAPDLVAMLILYRTQAGWRHHGYVGHHHKRLEHRRRYRILRHDPWVTPAAVVTVT